VLDDLFHAIGYGLCHQLPERSFFAAGHQLPVCARDTGIYLGFAVGLITLAVIAKGGKPTRLPHWPVVLMALLLVVAMLADGLTSYALIRESNNDLRLFTGLGTGWALAVFLVPMLNTQLWIKAGTGKVLPDAQAVALWLTSLVGLYLVASRGGPFLGVFYPSLVTMAILVTYTAINLLLVCLIPVFERRIVRFREALPQLSVAIVLTIVELGGAASLRGFLERAVS